MTSAIAFAGSRRIASGPVADVALKVRRFALKKTGEPILVFDEWTSAPLELDLRGSADEVRKRFEERQAAPTEPPRGRGRPLLGVVGREVTLLPRHWEWLEEQPGGASVTLRKLVEEAKRAHRARDEFRRSREAAYRFMNVMAGNLPGFEEASRLLFSKELLPLHSFRNLIRDWPRDICAHLLKLVERTMANQQLAMKEG
jgi:hypothetical protein